jgi:DNA repair protein RecO (recombination protein O)
MRISLQPAFVLHHRPYRETSLIVDLLTQEHGRIAVVARGVRTERSKNRAVLQCFVPLLVSWQGKSELMTMVSAEASGLPLQLRGDCLLGGFYLNELLMRVLQKQDSHPQIFHIYQQTLEMMQGKELQQHYLRIFEKRLLEELGYGLQLEYCIADKTPFSPEKYYYFHPDLGFERYENEEDIALQRSVFSGASLIALANEKLEWENELRDAKRLMRLALAPLLGNKPLQSRKLFIEVETT